MTVHGGVFLPGRLEASGRQRGGGGVPHQGLAKRRNLRFHAYELLALPSRRVEDLFTEIGRDPTCIFWG